MPFHSSSTVISKDNYLGVADLIEPILLSEKERFVIIYTRKDLREGNPEKWRHSSVRKYNHFMFPRKVRNPWSRDMLKSRENMVLRMKR